MDLNISVLREFIVLAQYLNFTKAASYLNMRQSTISKHIAALERELGFALLERSTNHATLTDGGKAFLEMAHRLVSLNDETVAHTAEVAKRAKRFVSVAGAYHQGVIQLFTSMLARYHNDNAWLDIDFSSKLYPSVDDMLKMDEDDVFAVCRSSAIDESDFVVRPLFRDTFSAILPSEHPLSSKKCLTLNDFKEETFMITTGSAQFENWPRISELCEARGFAPRTEIRRIANSYQFLSMYLFDSIYFIPTYAIPFYPMLKEPCFSCKVVSDPDCYFEYALMYRERNANPFAPQFVEEALQQPLPVGLTPCI
ncbi:LysR family transcriptional regulator [Adlercreutzia sp. R25]|uniref:LysR family transcriptional regulator n=1 Tax=Adlercreutzia shanghongiae TaxID=3111773 RepID=UPI002DB9E0F0|nr:LysR family transcriptional regulator [Adlercreutzia sp. R25]MEC4272103.1 LysR family transcriptional regulator [Adlercreutzia sp. R25]